MSFDKFKETALSQIKNHDRSNKGSIDKPILSLINKINSSKNYYTTSSCSGRIILIEIPENNKKINFNFLLRKHDTVSFEEVWTVVKKYTGENTVYFRQEPLILHIGCRTLKDAKELLKRARSLGIKKGGLFELEKRLVLELLNTDQIHSPVIMKGKLVINNEYLKILISEANNKLLRTFNKIKKLEDSIN